MTHTLTQRESVVFHVARHSADSFNNLALFPGYDMSTFIRRYSRYLNEKAFAYRQMAFDFVRVKKGYGCTDARFHDSRLWSEFV